MRKLLVWVLLVVALSGCQLGRFVWYNFANITDYKIFPSRPIDALNPQPFAVVKRQRSPESVTMGKKEVQWDDFLTQTGTVAFLIIKRDSIQYEWYGNGYAQSDVVASFSMAKSWVSALVMIALNERKIASTSDPITRYLPELRGRKGFDKITIRHLLDMCSGIKSSEGYYSPFSGVAKLYYGRNAKRVVRNLKIEEPPGKELNYKSVNTELLGMILSNVYSQPLAVLLEEKLWIPLGCEYPATWSLDKDGGQEKAFCCINGRARDFARLGLLYLKNGNWFGNQIIPANDVVQMTENHSIAGALIYSDHWWHGISYIQEQDTLKMSDLQKQFFRRHHIISDGHVYLPDGNYYAEGILGQFCYVNTATETVIVRLGKFEGKKINWPATLKSISGLPF